MFNCALLGKWL
jgi:hypothetical protein